MRAIYMSVAVLLIVVGCGGDDVEPSKDAGSSWQQAREKWGIDARSWHCDVDCPSRDANEKGYLYCQRHRAQVCGLWRFCRRSVCKVIRASYSYEQYDKPEDCLADIGNPQDLDKLQAECVNFHDEGDAEACRQAVEGERCQKASSYK